MGFISPLELQQQEEGERISGQKESRPCGRCRLRNIHGTSSAAWPGWAQSPRCWSPGAAPGKTLKTPGSSGVQHGSARAGKEAKVPRRKNKILDSSDHLFSPIPPPASIRLPLPLAAEEHTPPRAGNAPAGGGARAGPRVWRPPRAPGGPPARAAGRAQSRRRRRPPRLLVQTTDTDTRASDWDPFQEPLADSPKAAELIPEGEVSPLQLK